MQSAKKVLWSTAAVLSACGALIGGALTRAKIDSGTSIAPPRGIESLMASKTKQSGVSESQFYYQLMQLLEKEYVDPVAEDSKITDGTVRAMVASLNDPSSVFMNPIAFEAFRQAELGNFQGIGAEFEFRFTKEQSDLIKKRDLRSDPALMIPDLIVTFVAPGGPAHKASLKIGDRIDRVDGRWVLSSKEIKAFRDRQQLVSRGKLPASALNSERREMRDKLKNSITPGRAKELLSIGKNGTLNISAIRGTEERKLSVSRAETIIPSVKKNEDGSITLKFYLGVGGALKDAAHEKSSLVIDLRGSGQGSFQALEEAMQALVPEGTYGILATERGDSRTWTIRSTKSNAPQLTLLVDSSTRGNAAIFAQALAAHSNAKIVGSGMKSDDKVVQVVPIQGGAGFTLTTALYRTTPEQKTP